MSHDEPPRLRAWRLTLETRAHQLERRQVILAGRAAPDLVLTDAGRRFDRVAMSVRAGLAHYREALPRAPQAAADV